MPGMKKSIEAIKPCLWLKKLLTCNILAIFLYIFSVYLVFPSFPWYLLLATVEEKTGQKESFIGGPKKEVPWVSFLLFFFQVVVNNPQKYGRALELFVQKRLQPIISILLEQVSWARGLPTEDMVASHQSQPSGGVEGGQLISGSVFLCVHNKPGLSRREEGGSVCLFSL